MGGTSALETKGGGEGVCSVSEHAVLDDGEYGFSVHTVLDDEDPTDTLSSSCDVTQA